MCQAIKDQYLVSLVFGRGNDEIAIIKVVKSESPLVTSVCTSTTTLIIIALSSVMFFLYYFTQLTHLSDCIG